MCGAKTAHENSKCAKHRKLVERSERVEHR
jgi:hypothetical protein